MSGSWSWSYVMQQVSRKLIPLVLAYMRVTRIPCVRLVIYAPSRIPSMTRLQSFSKRKSRMDPYAEYSMLQATGHYDHTTLEFRDVHGVTFQQRRSDIMVAKSTPLATSLRSRIQHCPRMPYVTSHWSQFPSSTPRCGGKQT